LAGDILILILLDLEVKKHSATFLRAELGAVLEKRFSFCNGVLLTRMKGSWVCYRPLSGNRFTANLAGFTDTFTVFSTSKAVNAIAPGVEFAFLFNQRVSISACYEAELGRKRQEQDVTLNLDWRF